MTVPVREPGDRFKKNVVVLVVFTSKITSLELTLKFNMLAVILKDPGGKF